MCWWSGGLTVPSPHRHISSCFIVWFLPFSVSCNDCEHKRVSFVLLHWTRESDLAWKAEERSTGYERRRKKRQRCGREGETEGSESRVSSLTCVYLKTLEKSLLCYAVQDTWFTVDDEGTTNNVRWLLQTVHNQTIWAIVCIHGNHLLDIVTRVTTGG